MAREKRKYTSARERAEKQGSGFTASYLKLPDGVQLFKLKPGIMLIDILPYVAGEGNPWAEEGCYHWERTYHAHRGIGADSGAFLCPRMTSKSKCPVCEKRAELQRAGDPDDEDLIKDLSPKQRQLFNVINLKEPDKGVQLWDISYHLFGKVLDQRLRNADEDDEWEKFFHLEDGLTLKIGVEEKTFGGRAFSEVTTIDFKPRRKPYDSDIMESVHCLDELLIEPTYDALKKAFLETSEPPSKTTSKSKKQDEEEDEEEEDEEEEAPPPKKGKKPAKRSEPEDEEDDEEEEAPLPKSKKSKAKPEPEEEDEDDDFDDFDEEEEEEEEEEEAPPPKKGKKAVQQELPLPKSKKKGKPEPEEEEEDEEDEWEDDEEEEEAPPPKKSKTAAKSKKKGKAAKDDDEDDVDY